MKVVYYRSKLQSVVDEYFSPVQPEDFCTTCKETVWVHSEVENPPQRVIIKIGRFSKGGKKKKIDLNFDESLKISGKLCMFIILNSFY